MCSLECGIPTDAGRPLELLEREITQLASHIHAATCRWLGLVAEFDRREGWAQSGHRGAPAYADPAAAASGNLDEGASAESPTAAARRADALVLMADTLLASGPAQRTSDRFQVVVHVDAETLREGASDGRCETDDGVPLAIETARRLACDAGIVPLLERSGRPLSVGRKTRAIPPALRRALASRDRGCRFPGCGRSAAPTGAASRRPPPRRRGARERSLASIAATATSSRPRPACPTGPASGWTCPRQSTPCSRSHRCQRRERPPTMAVRRRLLRWTRAGVAG